MTEEFANDRGGIPEAVWDTFVRCSLEPEKIKRYLKLFKMYFDEDFNKGVREKFWNALSTRRIEEAMSYMIPAHAMLLAEMVFSLSGDGSDGH